MSEACFVVNAANFSYEPGAALRRLCASSDNSFCAAESSGEDVISSGVVVLGWHPTRQGADFGRGFFLRVACAVASPAAKPNVNTAATIAANQKFLCPENLR